MKTRMLVIASISLAFTFSAVAEEKAPYVGTWKLNLTKSRYDPGPPPKSAMAVNTPVDGGLRCVNDWVGADGKPGHEEFTAKFDGKDYPVKGQGNGDTISLSRPDPYTVDWAYKAGGKVTWSGRTVYSKDGKTRTLTTKGTTAAGKPFSTQAVYERQ